MSKMGSRKDWNKGKAQLAATKPQGKAPKVGLKNKAASAGKRTVKPR
jgi:hypothetical protein